MDQPSTEENELPATEGLQPKKSRKKAAPPAKPPATRSALEHFEVVQIHRSECKGAPYNPRSILPAAKRKLKLAIKKLGMLGPITWNRRTGNIVGGHQRLDIMDQLTGSKDYLVTVAAVDLTDAQEREANLLLNNANAMGDFDVEKLEALLKFPGLEIDSTGWDSADVIRLFGAVDSSTSEAQAEAEKAAEAAREQMAKYDARMKEASVERDNFYLCVIFKTYADRKAFTDAYNLDDNRYQSAEEIIDKMRPPEPIEEIDEEEQLDEAAS